MSDPRPTVDSLCSFADDGVGAAGLISQVANTSLCQFEPKKYGEE